MVESVDIWICKQNIELFQRKLSEATKDGPARETLMRMLAQQLTRLNRLTAVQKSSGDPANSQSSQRISNADEI